MRVSKNFESEQDSMFCPCCHGLVWDQHFINLIQILRDIMGIPFRLQKFDPNIPKSGGGFYRCAFFNKLIGGAEDSRHKHGSAMDVLINGWTGDIRWLMQFEAMKLGLSVGYFPARGYIHLDLRPGRPVLFP